MLLSGFQPLDKVKDEEAAFLVKLIGKPAYSMSFIAQLRVLTFFTCNKVFHRYAQTASYLNSRFNRGYLTSFVQVVIKAVLVYTGFCSQFFNKHTGVKQFGLQVFLKPHSLIIVGEKA